MNRRPLLIFALAFVAYFAVLTGAFEASRGSSFERWLIEDCILRPVSALIGVLDRTEPVQLIGRTIRSPSSSLHVTRGCEGIEIFLLLVAAVLAFPASWKAKAWGLAGGLVVAYFLSAARLIALHFTLRYLPAAWEALHGLVLPLAPILVMTFFFMHWSGRRESPAAIRRTSGEA